MALASRLRAEGRAAEAAEAYRRLLAVRPDLPDSWYNLALMERACGRFEAALAAYDEALRRGVSGPEEVRLNRAVILADDLGRHDLAETELEAALALRPDWPPGLLNLGNLHEDLGRREAARAAYARALEAEPGNAVALARLAGLHRPEGADDPMIARLRTALREPRSAEEQAELGFALGRGLDAAGDWDAAFEAYAAANAASRAAEPGTRYDRTAQAALIDRLIAAFPAPMEAEPGGEVGPVFVCGLFRSGSTLVEQMLARHSRVTAGGELGLVPDLASRIRPYPEALAGPQAAEIARQARALYLDGLRAARPEAELVTDKRPDNFLHIGLIKAMFPGARIVHTVRQPLDVILSNWFLHLDRSMPQALDLEDMAHWLIQHDRLMAHWKALYPDIVEIDYDRLVIEPRPVLEDLLQRLGLDWEDAVLEFRSAETGVRTASVWQVREPLYRRSSGRWRNYARRLGPVRAMLGLPPAEAEG